MDIQAMWITIINSVLVSSIVTLLLILAFSKRIGLWGMFSKMGIEEWKSIIPIYGQIQLLKKCKLSPWLVLLYVDFIIPIIGYLFLNRDVKWITIIMFIGLLCYRFMICVRLEFAFKKNPVFTFFASLFPSIFFPVLGCTKKTEYTEIKLKEKVKAVENK